MTLFDKDLARSDAKPDRKQCIGCGARYPDDSDYIGYYCLECRE